MEELTTKFSNDPTIGIAYVYFNFRRQEEQKINDLLASLLKQLAKSQLSLPSTVKDLYDQHKPTHTRPSLDEISKSLYTVITSYSQVFIIIDALDECQVSHGCRKTFLSEIISLQGKTETKLFTTSRPSLDIKNSFEGYISLDILASDEDIKRYLSGHMSQLPSFVLKKPKLQDEIATQVVQAAQGM